MPPLRERSESSPAVDPDPLPVERRGGEASEPWFDASAVSRSRDASESEVESVMAARGLPRDPGSARFAMRGSGTGSSTDPAEGLRVRRLFCPRVRVSTASTVGRAGTRGAGAPALVLASNSPRRRRLLQAAGISHEAIAPAIDDSEVAMRVGRDIGDRTVALAWMKASATLGVLRRRPGRFGPVLAADTLVADGARALGKPESREEAEAMLRSLAGRRHRVWTGHALVDPASGRRRLWANAADVRFGPIDPERLRIHLETGAWKGRAGGYSLDELLGAGWRIECSGDPDVVLGLSIAGVREALADLGGSEGGRS